MRFIVATASTGYCPAADSADSITASAPSKIAVATSDTSARVGTGLVIIDSSIWVATTTGLPVRRALRVICFCTPGTFSSGISTPRSPRATIRASADLDDLVEPGHRLRLLDLRHHGGAAAGDLLRLGDVLGPLHERQRHPVDAGVERGFEVGAVLRRQRRDRDRGVGQAHALAVRQLAGDLDARRRCGSLSASSDGEPQLAVVEQQRVPGLERGEDFRMRQVTRASRRRAPDWSRARRSRLRSA